MYDEAVVEQLGHGKTVCEQVEADIE